MVSHTPKHNHCAHSFTLMFMVGAPYIFLLFCPLPITPMNLISLLLNFPFLAQILFLCRENPPRNIDNSSQAQSGPDTSLVFPTVLRMAIDRRDSDLKSASKTKLRSLLIQSLFDHLSKKTM